MPDESIDVRTQLSDYLLSLRSAGVEWLPRGPKLAIKAAPAVAVAAPEIEATVPPEVLAKMSPDAMTLEQRRLALKLLADEIKPCMKCSELASTRTQTVFADGEVGVELCFVGEAPGADEDRQGLPFVGAAGQLLNRILAGCGLKREEVYICNILKCRPPGNRTPKPDEAGHCRDYLERQLALVAPKFICCLGGCAATNLLQSTETVGRLRKRFHDYRGIPVLVTYHPSYILRQRDQEGQQKAKKEVWEDMKLLLARMGRPIPTKS